MLCITPRNFAAMASFSTDTPPQESLHSQSPKSRITPSSPPFSAPPLPTGSPSFSETSSFIFAEPLPDNWFVTELLENQQLPEPHSSSSPLPLLLSAPASSPLLSTPSFSDAATMSTAVAIQFDPLFGMGSRATYSTWPVIDSSNGLLGQDLASQGSDISLSPPIGSRSVTASPPHHPIRLTVQQREIKRQRDQARRGSKLISRKEAGSSELSDAGILGIDAVASYTTSSHDGAVVPGSSRSSVSSISVRTPALGPSSPSSFIQSPRVTMADLSSAPSASAMPVSYATVSAPQISMLSEPIATSSSGGLAPSYMTAAPYSPPMHGHTDQDVFTQSYHEQQYLANYATVGYAHGTVPSQYPRGVMHDQQSILYPMPQLPPPPHSLVGSGALQQQQQQQQQHQQPQHPSEFGQYAQHAPVHQQLQHIHDNSHVPRQHVSVPSGVRVVQNRPKPQCWEHGCNGRQFSTFSNLLRHQREKSGQAAKAVCPNCGAEFTRTTARNGHLAHDKCKPRRSA